MHTTLRTKILLTAVATLALAAASARAADAPATPAASANYTVALSPALKVGQKFNTVSDVSSSNMVIITATNPTFPAPRTQNRVQTITAHVEADGEVLDVFPNGSMKKVALTVIAVSGNMDGDPLPGLPAAGAKVVIEKDDANKETVTVDDKPAGGAAGDVLSTAASMGMAKLNLQDVFGPKDPVAVGGTWPINTTGFMTMLKDFPGAESISGNMTLTGVTGTGDDRVFAASGNIAVKGIKLPPEPMFTFRSADMATQVALSVPATTTKGVRSVSIISKTTANADGSPDGGTTQIKVDITGDEKQLVKTTYR